MHQKHFSSLEKQLSMSMSKFYKGSLNVLASGVAKEDEALRHIWSGGPLLIIDLLPWLDWSADC